MSACTCGKASCALDRKRGGRCHGPHETQKTTSGAAVPTSSKFAALRLKMAASFSLTAPAQGLGKLPGAAVTRAPGIGSSRSPTGPKVTTGDVGGEVKGASYAAIRRKLAMITRDKLPPRTASNAAASMTREDVQKQMAQFGQGAQTPQGRTVPLQPSGGRVVAFDRGDGTIPALAARTPKPVSRTQWTPP